MKSKNNLLIENGSWEVVSPPIEANIFTDRWVFKLKKDWLGNILKYKAHWIVHGYKLKKSLNYVYTFAVVVKSISYKCLMAVEIRQNFRIWHIDIVTAFFYGFLNKVIYIEQLHLFKVDVDKVYKLLKALYRLKQIIHIWYKKFVEFLQKLGF